MEASRCLCEKVSEVPTDAKPRKWTLREGNNAHHHGIVSVNESPLYLQLLVRATAKSQPKSVGLFKLDLRGLLKQRYIRYEPAYSTSPDVRLRIVRAFNGAFYIQVNDDSPRCLLG